MPDTPPEPYTPVMTAADKTKNMIEVENSTNYFYECIAGVKDQRVMEKAAAAWMMAATAVLLSTSFNRQCAEETEQALAGQVLTVADVSMRKDAS